MVKKNVKARKRLAKLVLAALLCSGWAQSLSPSVAEAAYPPNETNLGFATVSKTGGESFEVTSSDTNTLGNAYMRINTSDRQYLLKGNGLYEAKAKQGTITSSDDNGALLSTSADGYSVTVSKDGIWGGVYGAWLNSSEVSTVGGDTGNKVEFEAGYANKVIGGRGQIGTVKGNTVVISGGATAQAFGGQVYEGNAEGNTVQITGGEVGGRPICMYTSGGITWPYYSGGKLVPQNRISASTEDSWDDFDSSIIAGGYSYSGNAVNNAVVFDGGTVIATDESQYLGGRNSVTGSEIAGGYSVYGTAVGNTVTIGSNAKADLPIVYGGVGKTEASGNTVTVKSRDIKDGIFVGGAANSKVNDNTVNILASVNPSILFGSSDLDFRMASGASGNTLNVAAKNVSSYVVAGFQNMNFYLPEDIANGDTMLTIKSPKTYNELISRFGYYGYARMIQGIKYGKVLVDSDIDADGNILAKPLPTDLTDVTFGVAALSGVNLKKGDTVNLIVDENGLTTDDTLKTTDSATLAKASFLSANSLTTDNKYELSISKKGEDTIIATVDNVTEQSADAGGDTSAVEEIKKSPVETRMGVVTMVNAGADLLAGQGMSNAADAAAAERSGGDGVAAARAGGFAPFAAVGLGNLRAKSGSHVDTKSIGLSLGFAREIENKSGKLLVGPVVEYGHGKYDSYQDNGITADGKSSYWGIGVIAKQTNHNGFYYEGSLRAGRTKSDYGSDSARPGNHVSYDSSATYWAAHLGAGKLFDMGHDNTLDVYGKYFYSHTGSDSTTIHIGAASEGVDFSAVNSHRLRIGTRLTHALNAKNKIYGGLAWQYEFNGDARAVYSVSGEAPSPSVKGSSGMLELGWQVKPGKSPMTIDLGVTGWVGKLRGIAANVQMNWTF